MMRRPGTPRSLGGHTDLQHAAGRRQRLAGRHLEDPRRPGEASDATGLEPTRREDPSCGIDAGDVQGLLHAEAVHNRPSHEKGPPGGARNQASPPGRTVDRRHDPLAPPSARVQRDRLEQCPVYGPGCYSRRRYGQSKASQTARPPQEGEPRAPSQRRPRLIRRVVPARQTSPPGGVRARSHRLTPYPRRTPDGRPTRAARASRRVGLPHSQKRRSRRGGPALRDPGTPRGGCCANRPALRRGGNRPRD